MQQSYSMSFVALFLLLGFVNLWISSDPYDHVMPVEEPKEEVESYQKIGPSMFVFKNDLADAVIHNDSKQNGKHEITVALHEPETNVKYIWTTFNSSDYSKNGPQQTVEMFGKESLSLEYKLNIVARKGHIGILCWLVS